MKPTKAPTFQDYFEAKLPEGATREDATSLVALHGSTPDDALFVCWNGHRFEVIEGNVTLNREDASANFTEGPEHFYEYLMSAHFPLDQRTTAEDWNGALAARPNEFNDGWLPKWDPDVPLDHEHALLSACLLYTSPSPRDS